MSRLRRLSDTEALVAAIGKWITSRAAPIRDPRQLNPAAASTRSIAALSRSAAAATAPKLQEQQQTPLHLAEIAETFHLVRKTNTSTTVLTGKVTSHVLPDAVL